MYFFKKYKDRMIVTGVAVILLIIIGITSRERIKMTKFEKIIGNLLTPVSKISFNVTKRVSNVFSSIRDIGNLKEENEELKALVAKLEEENRDYLNIIGKADYLKIESELLENTKHDLIPAQIISKEPGNWYDRFVIDKGLKDGVKKGATVVHGIEVDNDFVQEGIVGRIVDVGDNWAKVITIIDELNSISFKNIRTQDGGIITGSVDNTLSGYLFDSKSDVIIEDKLYTSGLGGSFVKDIYIGDVEEVISDEEDLMKRILVKPAINFKKLYNVFIISD